jgi:hypothetical protein
MRKENRNTVEYWLRFLESQGFKRTSNHGGDYSLWFYRDDFYVKISKLSTDDLDSFKFVYNKNKGVIGALEENFDDIETVIKAMADSMLIPLCINIEWIQSIFTEFLVLE